MSKQIDMGDASKETESATVPEVEAAAGKAEEIVSKVVKSEPSNPDNELKKRKRHEGETPEEKAERKRKKEAKKEAKKEKRKSKNKDSGDID